MTEPRPRRKLPGCAIAALAGALVLGAVVLVVWGQQAKWKRRFEAKVEEYRAAGEPVTAAEVMAARPPVPPEENAAPILLKAFEKLEEVDGPDADETSWVIESLVWGSPTLGTRRSEPLLRLAEDYLGEREQARGLLHAASACEGCKFPTELPDMLPAVDLAHLWPLRDAIRFCGTSAALHAEAGQPEAATDDLRAVLRLSAIISDEPFFLSALVAMASASIGTYGAERSLSVAEFSSADLPLIRRECARTEAALSLDGAFAMERAACIWVFRNASADLSRVMLGVRGFRGSIRLQAFLHSGSRWRDGLWALGLADEYAECLKLPMHDQVAEARRLGRETDAELNGHPHRHMLSMCYMPTRDTIIPELAAAIARLRTARTALAVDQWRLSHGGWPETLDQLAPGLLDEVPADPMDGQVLRYLKGEDGVRVYSLGWNLADDGGRPLEETDSLNPADACDIVFRLLNPELRGSKTNTLVEDLEAAGFPASELPGHGFTLERLTELGVTEEELRELGLVEDGT
jgi:hypothetical protein